MPLTLTIRPNDPGAAVPPPLRLHGGGASIGRAPACDWTLPDDRATISSRHCEIAFRDGGYVLADTSTNGTSINGRRIDAPQRLNNGDAIGIGPYDIAVAVSTESAAAIPPAPSGGTSSAGGVETMTRAAGIRRETLAASDAAILETAGHLLRELTAGTAMLLDHASRARGQIGGTREAGATASMTLPTLLSEADAARQVASAFDDLDRHQLATLKATQAAVKATLDLFSPVAIRAGAGSKADAAALWSAYERAFGAADTGFTDRFAREFRTAYESLAKPPKRQT